jgi:hypothetical protein
MVGGAKGLGTKLDPLIEGRELDELKIEESQSILYFGLTLSDLSSEVKKKKVQ